MMTTMTPSKTSKLTSRQWAVLKIVLQDTRAPENIDFNKAYRREIKALLKKKLIWRHEGQPLLTSKGFEFILRWAFGGVRASILLRN